MKKRIFFFLLALMLFVFGQGGAETAIEEVAAQFGENYVVYPQLNGMENEQVQQMVNDDIVLSSGAANHMITLLTLTGRQTLQVDYEAYLNDEIFSVVISARGKLPQKRDGHEYTALTYDLQTGGRLKLDAVFADTEAAIAMMEEIAVESLSEELNGYMEYSDVTPLPQDRFTLDEHGITFWYPAEQFSLNSGYSGACQFWYEELDGLWLKAPAEQMSAAEQKAAIEQSIAAGRIPHVPVRMGQNMQEIADEYRLLREPDEFPGGRYFTLEDPAFRGILIISDSMTEDYGSSEAEGIQLRRGALHGMIIGNTVQQEWRNVIGEPVQSIDMTESMAYDYGLPQGTYDVYHFGEFELRLHADQKGILCAIQLCK